MTLGERVIVAHVENAPRGIIRHALCAEIVIHQHEQCGGDIIPVHLIDEPAAISCKPGRAIQKFAQQRRAFGP
ncbi:MAG: hypothetical protein WKF47_06485 [Geodermatophilaceae bacterium]